MPCEITNFGGTFAISTTTVGCDDLALSDFEALTFVTVPNMGTHGDTGISQNLVSYSTWDRNVIRKGKGEADAQNADVEFLDIASAGMDVMLTAAGVNNPDNYAFRVTWPDGSIEYNRGLVTGPMRLKGANEDFKRVQFSLGMQQEAVVVEAPSS
jgi:hypothetical protein